MGIESKRVRRWLAVSASAAMKRAAGLQEAVAEPPSYIASFNPFPALVIGVTGAAMSAHAQTYLFQVRPLHNFQIYTHSTIDHNRFKYMHSGGIYSSHFRSCGV